MYFVVPKGILRLSMAAMLQARGCKRGRGQHPVRAHVTEKLVDDNKRSDCNYCDKTLAGAVQAGRWLPHLAGTGRGVCPNVPPEVKEWAIDFQRQQRDAKKVKAETAKLAALQEAHELALALAEAEAGAAAGAAAGAGGQLTMAQAMARQKDTEFDAALTQMTIELALPFNHVGKKCFRKVDHLPQLRRPDLPRFLPFSLLLRVCVGLTDLFRLSKSTRSGRRADHPSVSLPPSSTLLPSLWPSLLPACPSLSHLPAPPLSLPPSLSPQVINLARTLPESYRFPSEHTMSNTLVPAEFKRIESGVDKYYGSLGDAKGAICSDGATIHHYPLLNNMVLLPDLPPILEEVVDASDHIAGGGKKDAEYQADSMKGVIRKVGAKSLILGIFDGAGDIQKAAKLLVALFPWMSSMWCVPHLCNVIFKHIGEHEWFEKLLEDIKHVLHFFRGPHFQTCLLRQMCQTWDVPNLFFCAETRFAMLFMLAHRMGATKPAIMAALTSKEFADTKPDDEHGVAEMLREGDFFRRCQAAVDLLWPLMLLLRRTDGNAPVLSKVVGMALQFKASMGNRAGRPAALVPDGAVKHAQEVLAKYWDDLNSEIAVAAYVIDPEFLSSTKGLGMETDEMKAFGNVVEKLCLSWGLKGEKKDQFVVDVMSGLEEWRAKSGGVWSRSYVWYDATHKAAYKWWRCWGSGALQKVAVALTGLRAGASASEHAWSVLFLSCLSALPSVLPSPFLFLPIRPSPSDLRPFTSGTHSFRPSSDPPIDLRAGRSTSKLGRSSGTASSLPRRPW